MVAFYLFGTRRKNAAGVFAAGGRAVGGKRSNHFVELKKNGCDAVYSLPSSE